MAGRDFREYWLNVFVVRQESNEELSTRTPKSEAKEFEVAGIYVKFGHNLDYAGFNACYLSSGQCNSGPQYYVQLLVRYSDGKNSLAMINGVGVSACSLREQSE